MSSGQSLKKGSSVEPGLPNTLRMPNARNRSKVACLTVRGVVEGLPGTLLTPSFRDGAQAPDPEPRDSGLDASHRPGMTSYYSPRRRALHGRLSLRVRRPCLHAIAGLVGID